MLKREVLLISADRETLDKLIETFSDGESVDITQHVGIQHWTHCPTRTALAEELTKVLPTATHQRVSIIYPLREGESTFDWEVRVWSDQVISILSPSYTVKMAHATHTPP